MKKVILLMLSAFIFPRILVAQPIDLKPLIGTQWYGLYFGGQKAGYAMSDLSVDAQGNAVFTEEAQFRIVMATIRQEMSTTSKRVYGPDGELVFIESRIKDQSGMETKLEAKVQGDMLLLHAEMAGTVSEKQFPKPDESIQDALKQMELVGPKAKIGDTVSYSVFDPLHQSSIKGISTIAAEEMRTLDGVQTRVFKVKTSLEPLGLTSTSFITAEGLLLEDVLADILVMRLEPEDIAKDVSFSNDVVVSNAAMVEEPIEEPRTRDSLELVLKGPLKQEHLFSDARQQVAMQGDSVSFKASRLDGSALKPLSIPITEPSVVEWTKASMFVQSDNPKLIEKSKEILAGETDALKAVEKLNHWVYENVRSTFSARLSNALEVLEHLDGDCTEHSILFIGLARAAGIPAREVAGLIYVDSPQPGFFFHQWAKVWVGEWIDVDPTFDQAFADVTHIKLVEGDLVNQSRILPLIGQLDVEVVPTAAGVK